MGRTYDLQPELPPLLVRVALAKDWWTAYEILLAAVPADGLLSQRAVIGREWSRNDARTRAREMYERLSDIGEYALADAWYMLSVHPDEDREIKRVVRDLEDWQRAASPPSDLKWCHEVNFLVLKRWMLCR